MKQRDTELKNHLEIDTEFVCAYDDVGFGDLEC